MFGFSKKQSTAVKNAPRISVEKSLIYSGPYDAPEFGRTYVIKLENGNRLEIGAKTCNVYAKRKFDGTLRNAKGASIYFDPFNPAEKIIIESVIAEVVNAMVHIEIIDTEYLASDECKTFKDKLGRRWKLVG